VLYDTLNNVNRNDDNVFPNVQLRYKITDWADIRAAYSQGISRPDYRAIVPSITFTPGSGGSSGNTKLKPALSSNLDFAVSTYYDRVGLFTVSPFFKKISNLFYWFV
jgi:outer membrane receptor protein involved in Fe transport